MFVGRVAAAHTHSEHVKVKNGIFDAFNEVPFTHDTLIGKKYKLSFFPLTLFLSRGIFT